jgi:adsorption protein B
VAEGRRFKAVVLHDAEDVVHADEIRLFDVMIDRFDMVQLPVLPLIAPHSRWIAGHYADEFAEAHGKHIIMREAMGAAVPSAGVGCAFARDMIGAIAEERAGAPFDAASLTEDYEIGLRIAERKGRTVFVSMRDASGHAGSRGEAESAVVDRHIARRLGSTGLERLVARALDAPP